MNIPEIKLVMLPETEEAQEAIGYKWSDTIGKRHFIGGKPKSLNDSDYPICKQCSEKMTFYAQIDSIGDKFDIADCMVIHNFICFDCFTVHAELSQI